MASEENPAINAAIMLVDRISDIEETLQKMNLNLEKQKENVYKQIPDGICPCWIRWIEYHENGKIKCVFINAHSNTECLKCNPKPSLGIPV
tara:strand:+ start:1759 stop:2031 length:273 start_codon:yes stop_codon:yes gene_type:complete